MTSTRSQPLRLTTVFVLLGFAFALVSGALHPLGLLSDAHAQACHDHSEGHVDPPAPDEHHDHACVHCRLAHSLSQTALPAPLAIGRPDGGDVVPAPSRAATRPQPPLRRGCPPRGPPCA